LHALRGGCIYIFMDNANTIKAGNRVVDENGSKGTVLEVDGPGGPGSVLVAWDFGFRTLCLHKDVATTGETVEVPSFHWRHDGVVMGPRP
jgi:hypothetical protein